MSWMLSDGAYSQIGARAHTTETVITRLMGDALADPAMLSLAAGFTDNGLLPLETIQASMARLSGAFGQEVLQYGRNEGRPGLRRAAVELLRSYPGEADLGLDEADVLITNGSQQGLYLLMQALCDAGDIVLVEEPTYFVFLELLRGLGIEAVSIPALADGAMDPDGLADLLADLGGEGRLARVKAIYLMGTFANPSTRCIGEATKQALATVLQRCGRRIPVIEDMAYRELYFSEPDPARSLLALPEWADWPVIYAGTFTKPFATGLKVGFLASRESALLKTLARIKGHQDFGTAHLNQALLEEALQSGAYAAHLRRIRPRYEEKCALLEDALRAHGLERMGWRWDSPKGGLLLWVRGPAWLDTRLGGPLHAACLYSKVLYVPGDLCFASSPPTHLVRLSFGALHASLIPQAAQRFCEAAASLSPASLAPD